MGSLMSCVAASTIVGALLVGRYGRSVDRMPLVLLGIPGMGIGVLGLAMANHSIQSLGAGFGLSIAVACAPTSAQTLIQEETPQHLLGRTINLSGLTMTVAQLASIEVASIVADALRIRTPYFGAGCFLVLVGIAGYLRLKLKKLEQPEITTANRKAVLQDK